MEALAIITLLCIKHWYADFVRQTYQQTVAKGRWGNWTGITHSVDHVVCSVLILTLASQVIPMSLLQIVTVCLLEGIVHYHIDWIKVRFGSKDMTQPQYWTQFGADQLAHSLTYVGMTWLLL